jgi:uncharacterized protein (DUF2267 family)
MTSIPILDKNIHQTMTWIYAIEDTCGWDNDNPKRTFAALRAVLHTLRDMLPVESAIHLSAQLPLFIRGLFFENWSTHSNKQKIRKSQDFIIQVAEELAPYPDMNVSEVIKCVLQVLSERISVGEYEKILAILPKELKYMFP